MSRALVPVLTVRPLLARISLDALAHNLRVARRHAGSARLWAVVKANGYGHGLARVVRALGQADGFALLTLDEAANLRQMGVKQPILLLEGFFDAGEIAPCYELRLIPVLHRVEQLAMLEQARRDGPLDIYLKFNSGMNRLGFPLADLSELVDRARLLAGGGRLTLMTHFATADEGLGVDWQLEPFLAQARASGLPLSLANSAALLRRPDSLGDWARPGIMLYGASPFADVGAASLGLRPAMTLTSEIIAVQDLAPGAGVGYGLAWRAPQRTRVGVVACGYADGYPRHAPNGTPVLVDGQRCGLVGRVSMDMLAVDLSGLSAAGVGSAVTLWGEGLPVEDVATAAGTISYELLCALAPRVPVAEI